MASDLKACAASSHCFVLLKLPHGNIQSPPCSLCNVDKVLLLCGVVVVGETVIDFFGCHI